MNAVAASKVVAETRTVLEPCQCESAILGEDLTVRTTCLGVKWLLFCVFQTLSVSMLLRYSHHQIFVFIGQFIDLFGLVLFSLVQSDV